MKKTDPNDARLLALYLSKGLLPEVQTKNKRRVRIAVGDDGTRSGQ